ncbi:MAG: type II secretion system protein GspG [Candidatus Omnitrophica bacterium]|nr:type II secretion system protein GspG [Candidatus Omnitrophota bacterium]MCB9784470.1 type II secretion system protein GspG [Candidatus Omnitrophota bacterium]
MNLQRSFAISLLLFGSMFILTGCAPKPASEEGGDDAMIVSGVDDSEPAAVETMEASTPKSQPEKEILPFPHPGKMSEADIEKILSEKPPKEATMINLRFVSIALLLFQVIYDRYPTEEEGLAILLNPPMTPDGEKRDPIARPILIEDGWGNPIQYRHATWDNDLPGFEVWSWGPDGDESEDDIRPDFMDEIVKTAAMIEAGALDQLDSATSESSSDQ